MDSSAFLDIYSLHGKTTTTLDILYTMGALFWKIDKSSISSQTRETMKDESSDYRFHRVDNVIATHCRQYYPPTQFRFTVFNFPLFNFKSSSQSVWGKAWPFQRRSTVEGPAPISLRGICESCILSIRFIPEHEIMCQDVKNAISFLNTSRLWDTSIYDILPYVPCGPRVTG